MPLQQSAFDALDLNKDGEITQDELAAAFVSMGFTATEAAGRSEGWLRARDGNADRSVSFPEFVQTYIASLDPGSRPAHVNSQAQFHAQTRARRRFGDQRERLTVGVDSEPRDADVGYGYGYGRNFTPVSGRPSSAMPYSA